MAMNKKERDALETAQREARINRALRWSDYTTKRDVLPPDSYRELSKGWDARFYKGCDDPLRPVHKACSSSVYHGVGWEKTSIQQPKLLYSTRLKALQAQRAMAERVFAEMLAEIDEAIEQEMKDN